MKSNMSALNVPSCGPVRKNHLKPRVVSFGELDSPLTNGTWKRSATWLVAWVTLL